MEIYGRCPIRDRWQSSLLARLPLLRLLAHLRVERIGEAPHPARRAPDRLTTMMLASDDGSSGSDSGSDGGAVGAAAAKRTKSSSSRHSFNEPQFVIDDDGNDGDNGAGAGEEDDITFNVATAKLAAAAAADSDALGGGEGLTALALKTAADELELAKAGSSRYFSQKTCRNCGEPGHLMRACPEKSNLPCHLCGVRGHQSQLCPNQLCYICNVAGHRARVCPPHPRPRPTACPGPAARPPMLTVGCCDRTAPPKVGLDRGTTSSAIAAAKPATSPAIAGRRA